MFGEIHIWAKTIPNSEKGTIIKSSEHSDKIEIIEFDTKNYTANFRQEIIKDKGTCVFTSDKQFCYIENENKKTLIIKDIDLLEDVLRKTFEYDIFQINADKNFN